MEREMGWNGMEREIRENGIERKDRKMGQKGRKGYGIEWNGRKGKWDRME